MDNSARLQTSTYGRGNAGNVTIEAGERVSLNNDSVIFNTVEENGIGTGGNINISTGSLSISNGSQLQTRTLGKGNAGDVTINARDRVSLDGSSPGGFGSAINASVEDKAIGTGGDILINAGSLSVANEAALATSTGGRGDAGSINIQASDRVMLDNNAFFLSTVNQHGIGTGRDISITTGALSITNGSAFSSNTFEQGSAGNISIDVRNQLSLDNNSELSSSVGSNARGNGGTIRINAGSLSATNISVLQTSTLGPGNAGNVPINARDAVSFAGFRFDEQGQPLASGVSSTVEETGVGNAGTIRIAW
jgi:large exoprotein involved in heme utilization and adhesion